MSARPIIDAGPGLNFLSVNKERLLIAVLGKLCAPESLDDGLPPIERTRLLAAELWAKPSAESSPVTAR